MIITSYADAVMHLAEMENRDRVIDFLFCLTKLPAASRSLDSASRCTAYGLVKHRCV